MPTLMLTHMVFLLAKCLSASPPLFMVVCRAADDEENYAQSDVERAAEMTPNAEEFLINRCRETYLQHK